MKRWSLQKLEDLIQVQIRLLSQKIWRKKIDLIPGVFIETPKVF